MSDPGEKIDFVILFMLILMLVCLLISALACPSAV
jgi:hypothetical protein